MITSEMIVDWPVTIYYIYKFTNLTNGKGYIGYSENVVERFNKHRLLGERYVSGDNFSIFHGALNRYGWDGFSREIIFFSLDAIYTLKEMEPYFIKLFNTYCYTGHGYNMTLGGEGTPGHYISEETRMKMSEVRLGEKNHFYGKTHDDKTRAVISEKTKQRLQDNPRFGELAPNYGKTRSEKAKESVRNKLSKGWEITHPDGEVEMITNLKGFCRDNNIVFTRMIEVASGKYKSHKGYIVKRLGEKGASISKEQIDQRIQTRGHTFLITHPDGQIETITGMKKFCRENGLSSGVMFKVASGEYAQHKGFTCKRVEEVLS